MARNSIGLDVGTRAVRLAEVQTVGGKPAVTAFGRILLPPGSVERGEVRDPAAVGEAIAVLWKRLGLSGRSVRVALANGRVAVRTMEIPAVAPEDLEGAVRFQAAEHIPIPLDQAVMDYEVLEEIEGSEEEKQEGENAAGAKRLRVLVVAAERASIEPLLSAARSARLGVGSVELDAYPLVRCFARPEGTEAIVDVGAGVTTIVVAKDGKIRFTRILPSMGGEDFTSVLADSCGGDAEKAEALKREASKVLRRRAQQPRVVAPAMAAAHVLEMPSGHTVEPYSSEGWEDHGDAAMPVASEGSMAPEDQAADLLEPVVDRLVSEVQGSLDFYSGHNEDRGFERVVLTGGGSLLGGLREEMESYLGVPVVMGDPFVKAPVAKVNVSDEEISVAGPFMGVAVGLALAGVRR